MNIFFKAYCRTFQFLLKLSIPFLPYKIPKVLNSYNDISIILKKNNLNNIFIVTGPNIYKKGLLNELENNLKQNNINYYIFNKTESNPTINNVLEAKKEYIKNNCSAIIAFGGGSPIDLAKILGASIVTNKPINKMKGLLKIRKKLPLLIAIPTTAGSGSETTLAAVITDDNHIKYAINDFCLIPKYVLLDYKLTLSLQKNITSTTGMDALTHAIEAYIGRSLTNETKMYSLKAIELVLNNLYKAYQYNDEEAKNNMLIASFYAGCAFSKSYVGYVHALSHAIGGKYNLPHGLLNAIILPKVLIKYDKCIYNKIAFISKNNNIANENDNNKIAFNKFINYILELNKKMNIPTKINELDENDIHYLATLAFNEANPLYPVPKLFSIDDLEDLLKDCK